MIPAGGNNAGTSFTKKNEEEARYDESCYIAVEIVARSFSREENSATTCLENVKKTELK